MNTNRTAGMPLYVDVDGTLVKSNLLVESALRLFKRSPLSLLSMLRWLLFGGRATLKHEIAKRVDLDASKWPYRDEIVEMCHEARDAGRRVVLATGADLKYADAVAKHLGVFDAIMGTTAECNLTGQRKLAAILGDCGDRAFVYAGDELQDLHIWNRAAGAVVCGDDRLAQRAAKVAVVQRHVLASRPSLRVLLRAIRIHQWAKNLLIFLPFLPLLGSLAPEAWLLGVVGFVCFGLCASSVYLTNDLLDLDVDRAHARKCRRPIPSGDVGLSTAILLAAALLLAAFALAAFVLPFAFVVVIALYWFLTSAYSLDLKRRVNVDIMTLAMLYTMRVLAGSAALMVRPSFWMLAFSVFLFFSLAVVKRLVELQGLRDKAQSALSKAPGRGYVVEDMPILRAQGIASGQLAVLVLALYINDPSAAAHFTHPEVLWGVCPFMLLWINRVWLKVNRNEINEDPVLFALRDRFSLVVVAAASICLILAA